MPLKVTTETPAALAAWVKATATPTKPAFVLFYASLTDGRSWCPDCRQAEPFVNGKFADAKEEVKVVYVGQKPEWRESTNPWRQAPFSAQGVPTLLKVTSDGAFHRMTDPDIWNQEKLDAFVGTSSKL